MTISYTFTKAERLKSQKRISRIFKHRQSVGAYPLRVFWAETEHQSDSPAATAFSVSKKNFKRAVKRNRFKRLMREVHRLNKHQLYNALEQQEKTLDLMLVYVGKEEHNFAMIEKKYGRLIKKLLEAINTNP